MTENRSVVFRTRCGRDLTTKGDRIFWVDKTVLNFDLMAFIKTLELYI